MSVETKIPPISEPEMEVTAPIKFPEIEEEDSFFGLSTGGGNVMMQKSSSQRSHTIHAVISLPTFLCLILFK